MSLCALRSRSLLDLKRRKRESTPARKVFLPDLQPHGPAMGQKDGEKWADPADLQPTIFKSDRLLVPYQVRSACSSGPHRCSSATAASMKKMCAFSWPFHVADCHMANHSPPTPRKPTPYSSMPAVNP